MDHTQLHTNPNKPTAPPVPFAIQKARGMKPLADFITAINAMSSMTSDQLIRVKADLTQTLLDLNAAIGLGTPTTSNPNGNGVTPAELADWTKKAALVKAALDNNLGTVIQQGDAPSNKPDFMSFATHGTLSGALFGGVLGVGFALIFDKSILKYGIGGALVVGAVGLYMGKKKDKANVGVPTFDDLFPLLVQGANVPIDATKKAAFQQVFLKWNDIQKQFAYDYLKGLVKLKSFQEDSKEWNDAFTQMNDYLIKTYPDEFMKMKVLNDLS